MFVSEFVVDNIIKVSEFLKSDDYLKSTMIIKFVTYFSMNILKEQIY